MVFGVFNPEREWEIRLTPTEELSNRFTYQYDGELEPRYLVTEAIVTVSSSLGNSVQLAHSGDG